MSTLLSPFTRPLSVLIVEDNREGADALAMFPRQCGYVVRLAYDGAHAVQAIRSRPHDVVLCDIALPEKDGYEVAREARRVLGHRPLLVAVPAYDSPMVRECAQSAGFDYFFSKPTDPNELDRVLQQHAERLAIGDLGPARNE